MKAATTKSSNTSTKAAKNKEDGNGKTISTKKASEISRSKKDAHDFTQVCARQGGEMGQDSDSLKSLPKENDDEVDSFLESFMMEQDMMFHVFEEEKELTLSNAPPPISPPTTIQMLTIPRQAASASEASKNLSEIVSPIAEEADSPRIVLGEHESSEAPAASYYLEEAERQKRRVIVKKEMNNLLRQVQENELTRPMESAAVKALQQAAQTLCYTERRHHKQSQQGLTEKGQGGYHYLPSIKTTILNESLIREAERLYLEWNAEANEFPLEYGIALRSVVCLSSESVVDGSDGFDGIATPSRKTTTNAKPQVTTAGDSPHDLDLTDSSNTDVAVLPGNFSARPPLAQTFRDHSNKDIAASGSAGQQDRLKKVDAELNELLQRTEKQKLSEPMKPKAVSAFRRAAHQLCYTKKYKDVWTNEMSYFPNVADAIINANLIFEAEKLFEEEEKQRHQDSQVGSYTTEEFPLEYGIALQAMVMPSSRGHSSFSHSTIANRSQRNSDILKNKLNYDDMERMAASMMNLGSDGSGYDDFASKPPRHVSINEDADPITPNQTSVPIGSLNTISSSPKASPPPPVTSHEDLLCKEPLQAASNADDNDSKVKDTDFPPNIEPLSEVQMRHQMIDAELNKTLLQVQEQEELLEPLQVQVVEALQRAAQKVCYVRKYYDAIKDEFVYFPSLKNALLNETLTDEAVMYLIESEFPVEVGIALRSVVSSSVSDDDDGDLLEYMERLAIDVDIDSEIGVAFDDIDETITDNDAKEAPAVNVNELQSPRAETPESDSTEVDLHDDKEKLIEAKLRRDMIDTELTRVLAQVEEQEEFEEPFSGDVVDALRKAAYTVCFVKKYYDVIKDEFIYFPGLKPTILNETLTDKAAYFCCDDDDDTEEEPEFPFEFGVALRSAVATDDHNSDDDDLDLEYMERLAIDVDIGDVDIPNSAEAVDNGLQTISAQSAGLDKVSAVDHVSESQLVEPGESWSGSLRLETRQGVKTNFAKASLQGHALESTQLFKGSDSGTIKRREDLPYGGDRKEATTHHGQASMLIEGHSSFQQRQKRKEERRRRRFLRESRKKQESQIEDLSKSISVFKILGGEDLGVEDERSSERAMRQQAVDEELDELISQAELKELSKPVPPAVVDALKIAAMQVCYVKKFYDALKDHFIYFPTVHAMLVDQSLTKTAQKHVANFPTEVDSALRSVAVQSAADDHKHKDHHDDMVMMEYAERLAIDVDLVEAEDEEDFAASDSKIAYWENEVEGSIQAAIHSSFGSFHDDPSTNKRAVPKNHGNSHSFGSL